MQAQSSRAEKKCSLLFVFDTDITFLQNVLPVWRSINQQQHKPCKSIAVHSLACLKVPVILPNCSWLQKSFFFPTSIIYFPASWTAALSRSYIYKHPSLIGLIFSADTSSSQTKGLLRGLGRYDPRSWEGKTFHSALNIYFEKPGY